MQVRVPAKVSGPKPFALRFDASGRPHCITLKGSDQNSLPHNVLTKLTQWLDERWHRPSGHTVCPRMTLGTNENNSGGTKDTMTRVSHPHHEQSCGSVEVQGHGQRLLTGLQNASSGCHCSVRSHHPNRQTPPSP